MSVTKIDGRAVSTQTRHQIAHEVGQLKERGKHVGLAVILVGADPASEIYVNSKIKACAEVGIESYEHRLPADSTEKDVREVIERLNKDDKVHGILLQLPLPVHLEGVQESLVQTISPHKDVDGLTVTNAGKLFLNMDDGLFACTPLGSLHLIKSVEPNLRGKEALVIGRSNLFGRPMAQLLLREDCTVTMAHRYTQDLAKICARADIVVVAVGIARMVKKDWVKEGAIVIDVGINRLEDKKICGDVDYDAMDHVRAITPVPGGVGPMTITYLLSNTLKAAKIA
jgi:methylenetetrahydrofolate dehydrogenase (NADP+)/methenyltetrahydrofolate cyclohydrolase